MMYKHILCLGISILITGCATTQPNQPNNASASITSYSYADSAIADLLIAEASLQREQFPLALSYYQQHAQSSNSPAISKQTVLLSLHVGNAQTALLEANHWLQQEPNNAMAHEAAALALIMLEQTDTAALHVDQLLRLEPEQGLSNLLTHSQGIGEHHTKLLIKTLASLVEQHPNVGTLWYAKALQQQEENQLKPALTSLNKALGILPTHIDAQLLKSRLLFDTGREGASLRYSQKQMRLYPTELRLRAQYIRLLLEAHKEKQAQQAFSELARLYPDKTDLRLALAVFAMEQGSTQTAKYALEQLLAEGYLQDDIRLYLAHAAEQDEDYESAIYHYQHTQSRETRLKAGFQTARLYHLQKNYEATNKTFLQLREDYPDQAFDLYLAEADLARTHSPQKAHTILTQALTQFPQNPDLLYFRALMAEQFGDIDSAEQDLRQVLQHHPNNAAALNALGYILTDHTNRHQEAYDYIAAALALEPDNPAILDSKGWVLFNLGRTEEALDYLQRSYLALGDEEVAKHLLYVLQALGLEKEAQDILLQHPNLNLH